MSVVHLLHGLPGSGKTTFARKLESEQRAMRLNHDEWMIALHGNNPPADQMPAYRQRISALIWTMTGRVVERGIDVILDHGFWTRAERDEARARVIAMGAEPRFYQMICPDELAMARVVEHTRESAAGAMMIDEHAWRLFRARFEPLGADERAIPVVTGS